MTNERRKNKRVPISLPARWDGISGKHETQTTDISMGGCFISTYVHVTVDELIVVELLLPDGGSLKLKGRVTSYEPLVGFSLRFLPLTEVERATLAQIIKERSR